MHKIILITLWLSLFSLCEPIKFKEEKYISALQTTLSKEGWITHYEDSIEIYYPKEKKSFLFNQNHIIEKKAEETKVILYEENLALTIFSKVIKAIYTNEFADLNTFFTIKKQDDTFILFPNEHILNFITTIEYKKNLTSLEFLKINFTNEDWIYIVETK